MHTFYQLGKNCSFSSLFIILSIIFPPGPGGGGGGLTEKDTPLFNACCIECLSCLFVNDWIE